MSAGAAKGRTRASGHSVVIVGGGTAGITVAARLRRKGIEDVALIEPSDSHVYQPLLTLVGAGLAPVDALSRPESRQIPKGVRWIKDAAVGIDPEAQVVATARSGDIGYDYLVVCPGIQLDWAAIPGLTDTLGRDGVSSNYRTDLAPRTWDFIRNTKGGHAVFTMPSGPIKCGGAPQKIAYLAADYWKRNNVPVKVTLVVPTPKIFGVPEFAEPLAGVIERYGIDLRTSSEVVEVNPDTHEVVVRDHASDDKYSLPYDMVHVTPPQSAPDWIKATPLAASTPGGYVDIDKHTMVHTRWPNVFSLGDAGSSPNSKTGAAIRKQAPVVVTNLIDTMNGRAPSAQYGGYSSCPIVTAHNRMLLAEFDYSGEPTPSIPLINTRKERYDMWLLKRYGLPFMYWHLMLKGLA